MKRGEVWTAAGGPGYGGKPRPVIVVQNDRFDATESVTVCGLTTTEIEADFGRVRIRPNEQNGLVQTSWAMVDKLVTVRRSKMRRRLGAIGASETVDLNRALLTFLGLSA